MDLFRNAESSFEFSGGWMDNPSSAAPTPPPMSIPEPAPDFASACAVHGKAQALFAFLQQQGLALDTLSMGMSDDLEAAIAAGSTLVRVGSAIFGPRATKA